MHTRFGGKAEPVRTDDRAAVNCAACADTAVLAHGRIRVKNGLIADLAVLPDIDMGIDGHARTEYGMIVNVGKG